jgi:hypothetical protein
MTDAPMSMIAFSRMMELQLHVENVAMTPPAVKEELPKLKH